MTDDVEQILATANVVSDLLAGSTSAMSLYLTVMSGYLLVAYLVGKELSFLQTTIVTTLFMFFTITNTVATVLYMKNAYYFSHTYGAGFLPGWTGPVTGILLAGGILAAVKFMWDVRHQKKE